MKKARIVLVFFVCVLVIGAIGAYAASERDLFDAAGQYLREFLDEKEQPDGDSDAEIALEFHGNVILMATVEYNRNLNFMRDEETAEDYQTDYDIVNSIVMDILLKEEAQRQGLMPTQEDVDAYMESLRSTIESSDGVRESIETYCAGAGITLEEYYTLVEELAPGMIAKQNLRDAFHRQWCEDNGVEYTKVNPPAEMVEAREAYFDELFETYRDDIVYYIDVPKD